MSDQSPSSNEDRVNFLIRASQVFTPSAPIDDESLFSGRVNQVFTVISAVSQKGQHVILYGERGVGKTSLANVISEMMKRYGLNYTNPGVINCDGTDDFSSLWKKIFREITIRHKKETIGFENPETWEATSLANYAPEPITPDTVRLFLQNYAQKSIIIIDEVDRLRKRQVTTLLADTIKNLSDRAVDSTIVLVGVADSVNNLVAEHASIERSLVQVQMPRMSTEELCEILEKGLKLLNMSVEENVEDQIAFLSQGLPHYVHLLSLYATQSAILNNRQHVIGEDLGAAISMAVKKAQQSIINSYHKAVSSHRETLYQQVLLSCALAPVDNLGFFAAADVRRALAIVMSKSYKISAFSRHLNDFCEDKRGSIFQKIGSSRNYRFRFVNPLMKPFIVMDGIDKGLINQEMLHNIR